MNDDQFRELMYQALQTEQGGIAVYETAIKCAVNDDLREEWETYLDETRHHEEVVLGVFQKLGLDPDAETPGRAVVRFIGESLVAAMEMALASGPPEAAELVAGECVVHAETKDHLNWSLISTLVEDRKGASGEIRDELAAACEEIGDDEDEHLYHSKGWTRELWIESLGMKAVLPPPEEQKNVTTAIGASRAEQARDDMK